MNTERQAIVEADAEKWEKEIDAMELTELEYKTMVATVSHTYKTLSLVCDAANIPPLRRASLLKAFAITLLMSADTGIKTKDLD